jgi:hypothetical protein
VLETLVEHGKNEAEAHVDLPVGNAYWRLKGLSHGKVGTETSATWPFVVGARTANKCKHGRCKCSHGGKPELSASTSWGSTLDLDGDGFTDIAIGRDDQDTVFHPTAYVYAGSPAGVSPTPAVVLHDPLSPNAGEFGETIASLGDVNGDGFADLLMGNEGAAIIANQNYGAVYVYFGRPGGIQSSPDQTFVAPTPFGFTVAGAGDIDADGYADAAVPIANGAIDVYRGSVAGLLATPSVVLSVPSFPGVLNIDGAADVNGDGFGDIVASAPIGGGGPGRVFVFYGGPSGPSTAPDVTITGTADSFLFGEFAVNAGDLDGDGFTDIATNWFTFGASHVSIYYGGPCGLSLTPQTFDLSVPPESPSISALAGIEDIDGDGFDDLAIGASSGSLAGPGHVFVFRGSASGLATLPAQDLLGPPPGSVGWGVFGSHLGQLGDVNGDAIADMGAQDQLSVNLYYGSPSGLSTTPSLVISSPQGNANFGVAIR